MLRVKGGNCFMREMKAATVKDFVKDLILEASYNIGSDVKGAVAAACGVEPSPQGRAALCEILESYEIASTERVAICQDTGMAVLFVEVGQDVRVTGGSLQDALNEGVRQAYRDGYLRKSVVSEPLFDRKNTGDNTPAVIHYDIVPGDTISILVTPKGFGSENMSAVKMLTPAAGVEGVRQFVVDTVRSAGPNPCPPVIVGVGIGGTMEKAAILAKRMTARPVGQPNADPRYAALEKELLTLINKTGVGPAGTGGRTTALAVAIDFFPTHIAGLPVAVNICCHAARHAQGVL